MPEIQQMQQTQGAKLMPVSEQTRGRIDSFHRRRRPTALAMRNWRSFRNSPPISSRRNWGARRLPNASFDTLKQFTHLRALHLEETHITGDGLAKLASLSQLTYLNFSGTQVTEESVRTLSSMKNLRHIYLYNTPAQPAANPQPAQPIARSTAMTQTHLQPACRRSHRQAEILCRHGSCGLGDADRSTRRGRDFRAWREYDDHKISRRATANGLTK